MTTKPILRPASLADAAPLARVHVAARRKAYAGFLPEAELDRRDARVWTHRWQEWLTAAENNGSCCLAIEMRDAGIVGFVAGGKARKRVEPWEGAIEAFGAEIYSIYVLPECQGGGHGRALLRAIAARLRETGHEGLILWVYRDNPHRGFYEHLHGRLVACSHWQVEGRNFPTVAYAWADLALLAAPDSTAFPSAPEEERGRA